MKHRYLRSIAQGVNRARARGGEGGVEVSTHNLNVSSFRSLVTPRELKAELPHTAGTQMTVSSGRAIVRAILEGHDPRFLAIVGPCSVHDVAAAREYAERLAALATELAARMIIVMRTYFEKPRTTVGWKGLINDPHLDGSFDMEEGLRLARRLLLDVNGLGLPAATEMLDPITPQYIDDLVSWAAIGARTIESQTHRQMASGLSMPVGYKNTTEGKLEPALDAFCAAHASHRFLGIDEDGRTSIVTTKGNPVGHLILRGGRERPNYDPQRVAEAAAQLAAARLPPRLLVDCSHANSGKRHERQQVVWSSVIEQRARGNGALIGAMLESNLEEGRQDLTADRSGLRRGVSITDACIGWDETERLLREAWDALGRTTA
jgi:3-deoxy-7-phosphoheptulonate synthase